MCAKFCFCSSAWVCPYISKHFVSENVRLHEFIIVKNGACLPGLLSVLAFFVEWGEIYIDIFWCIPFGSWGADFVSNNVLIYVYHVSQDNTKFIICRVCWGSKTKMSCMCICIFMTLNSSRPTPRIAPIRCVFTYNDSFCRIHCISIYLGGDYSLDSQVSRTIRVDKWLSWPTSG